MTSAAAPAFAARRRATRRLGSGRLGGLGGFWFGQRQLAQRGAQQPAHQLAVLDVVLHQEIQLGARIRRRFGRLVQHRPAGQRRLDEQLVVADQREHLAFGVERIFTKHLPVRDRPDRLRALQLVEQVFDECLVGGHYLIRAHFLINFLQIGIASISKLLILSSFNLRNDRLTKQLRSSEPFDSLWSRFTL